MVVHRQSVEGNGFLFTLNSSCSGRGFHDGAPPGVQLLLGT